MCQTNETLPLVGFPKSSPLPSAKLTDVDKALLEKMHRQPGLMQTREMTSPGFP